MCVDVTVCLFVSLSGCVCVCLCECVCLWICGFRIPTGERRWKIYDIVSVCGSLGRGFTGPGRSSSSALQVILRDILLHMID